MLATKNLVDLIERHADELTHSWITIVRMHPATPSFHDYDEQELYDRAYRVFSQLGRWISHATTKEDIARHYQALGAQRYQEGFSLSEVIQALVITRRVLWFKVLDDGLLDSALDLQMALQLYNRVMLFFDRAIYFAALGYEEACKAAH
jgi:hypothetical protein